MTGQDTCAGPPRAHAECSFYLNEHASVGALAIEIASPVIICNQHPLVLVSFTKDEVPPSLRVTSLMTNRGLEEREGSRCRAASELVMKLPSAMPTPTSPTDRTILK